MNHTASSQSQPERRGDFELLGELGRGGMGVVYEARQVSLNRKVALKVMNNVHGLMERAVQRFRREAEAAAKLHHTNIVPVYATGEEDGVYFYAMELVEGPSLDRVLRFLSRRQQGGDPAESPTQEMPAWVGDTVEYVPHSMQVRSDSKSAEVSDSASGLSGGGSYFDQIAGMLADVADALQHAHAAGVIHRDVKPSNLLLSSDGRLSINDFGLARFLDQPGMTVTGEFVGTPKYVSPEQITGGRVPVDHRTDIYSLGATLYELLTLRPAFSGESRDQLLSQIMHKEPIRPRKLNRRVPVDLETICLKAMEKDPDRRYASAGEMAADLRRYVNRFAIQARRAGPVMRMTKWVRRHPGLSAGLAGMTIAVVIAGVFAYGMHRSEQDRIAAAKQHELELLEEKRSRALEKAILAARQQDTEAAEAAIREAESLGSSAGQLRMLRGQLAMHQGKMKEAMDHLNQATRLLPESVAAWAMLSVVNATAGNYQKAYECMAKAISLTPDTPEDFLFLGHAESILDAERGLRTLNKAVRRRPSVLARLIRAEVLTLALLNSPDATQARQAMADVRLIKQQMPDNPLPLNLSISVHLSCWHAAGELNDSALRKEALAEGRRDADALARFDTVQSVVSRYIFLDEVGAGPVGLPALRKIAETKKSGIAMLYYASDLYRRGEIAKAAEVLEKHDSIPPIVFLRAVALAELPNGRKRAGQLYSKLAAGNLRSWDLFNSQLLLRILGRKEEATKLCRAFLKQPEFFPPLRKEPFQRVLEYCAGQRSAESLIDSLRGVPSDLCNAHLSIAVTKLADGDRKSAKKHLHLCVGTHYYPYLPYDFGKMLLSRMERDPTWPPWIPPERSDRKLN